MQVNPIRKTRGRVFHSPDGGMAYVLRKTSWYAICPDCGEKIKGRQRMHYGRGDGGTSRKLAKDALYDHQRKEHTPGQVETAPG